MPIMRSDRLDSLSDPCASIGKCTDFYGAPTLLEGVSMVGWVRLAIPAAVVATSPAPSHAVQYLTLTQSQKLSFPAATNFVPIDAQAWNVASDGKNVGRYIVDRVI